MCVILYETYQTLFTTNLIVPVSLPGFENVGEFVNHSKNNKIICTDELKCNYLFEISHDITSNLAKYGVLGKLDKFLNVLPISNLWLEHIEELSVMMADKSLNNNTLVGVLIDSNYAKQNAELLIHKYYLPAILKLKFQLNSAYVSNCHLLNVGTTSYYYSFFEVPYFNELKRVETFTSEFGFLKLWEANWMARFQQRIQKTIVRPANVLTQGDDVFVNFTHLEPFFIIFAVLVGMCAGGFLVENLSQSSSRRKLYNWFSVVATFLCLQYFKLLLMINMYIYINQK